MFDNNTKLGFHKNYIIIGFFYDDVCVNCDVS